MATIRIAGAAANEAGADAGLHLVPLGGGSVFSGAAGHGEVDLVGAAASAEPDHCPADGGEEYGDDDRSGEL
jgi:hypothetical protein